MPEHVLCVRHQEAMQLVLLGIHATLPTGFSAKYLRAIYAGGVRVRLRKGGRYVLISPREVEHA
jgi:hypothetical protein